MSTSITTVRDIMAADEMIEAIIESNDIGQLCRKGRTIYYAYSTDRSYVEGVSKVDVARKVLALNSK